MSERIDTGSLLHSVARTREVMHYRQLAEQAEYDETLEKPDLHTAIRLGALALANAHTAESGYRSPEGTLYALMGRLNSFSEAQTALDNEASLTREEKRAYKIEAIHFNHALKDAIDLNPSTGFNGMLRYMTEAYASINRNKNVQTFSDQARIALVGMQHERAAEQIIDATEGFEVDYDREVGVEDELKGVDIYVRDLTTNQSFGIDIKASDAAAQRARAKSHHPDLIVKSMCRNSEFGDRFSLPPDIARNKAPDFNDALVIASRYASTRSLAA